MTSMTDLDALLNAARQGLGLLQLADELGRLVEHEVLGVANR